jgi:hypothetical protein
VIKEGGGISKRVPNEALHRSVFFKINEIPFREWNRMSSDIWLPFISIFFSAIRSQEKIVLDFPESLLFYL